MRRFVLIRAGAVVAEGMQASNGRVALVWLGANSSTVSWDSIESALLVHRHAGSEFSWLDDEDGHPFRQPGEAYRQQRMAP